MKTSRNSIYLTIAILLLYLQATKSDRVNETTDISTGVDDNLINYQNEKGHGNGSRVQRKRRYDYEDTYDWGYDDSKIDYDDNTEENAELKKLLLNWQKIAIRMIFIISAILMFICCCWFACRNFLKMCCGAWYNLCRSMCNMCLFLCNHERDPVYQQVKMFSENLGIKIDYETYKNIKEGAVEAVAESGFVPAI